MAASSTREPNRWAVLALLGTAQLMVVLDATIVNIALPSAQSALRFSNDARQWIITGYALASGIATPLASFLSLRFGSKRVWVTALAVFTFSSMLCGFAPVFSVLILGGAAVLLPHALNSIGAAGPSAGSGPPHGLTEIIYAYASGAHNNGSAFGGLNGNTLWYNTTPPR